MHSSQVEAANQIMALRTETYELRDRVKKCKAELAGQRSDDLLVGTFQVIEQATQPLVASLDGFEELKLNLKSFFIVFPAHDEEWEEV